jgi:hypothetical protein
MEHKGGLALLRFIVQGKVQYMFFFFFSLVVLGLELRAYTLSHSTSSSCPGWLQTEILLISAS